MCPKVDNRVVVPSGLSLEEMKKSDASKYDWSTATMTVCNRPFVCRQSELKRRERFGEKERSSDESDSYDTLTNIVEVTQFMSKEEPREMMGWWERIKTVDSDGNIVTSRAWTETEDEEEEEEEEDDVEQQRVEAEDGADSV